MKQAIRVLVVEDEPSSALLLASILRRLGLQPVQCTSGAQARDYLLGVPVDLLVIDFVLPDLRADELVEELRAAGCEVPFIVVSAGGEEALALRALQAGALDYVRKDTQLAGRLAQAVDRFRRGRYQAERLADHDWQRDVLRAQRLEALGTFAAGVSHEFNNLLAVLAGNLDLLGIRVPALAGQAGAAEPLAAMRAAIERGRDLTGRVVQFAREDDECFETIDLVELFDDLRAMARGLVPEGIAVHWESTLDRALVRANRAQLHQAVLNILANAITALTERDDPRIDFCLTTVALADGGDGVVLAVSDNGWGIDPVTQHRIFDPFFSTRAPGQGTGLGLSAVKGIVERHRGSVGVHSRLGRGTTIEIRLPVREGTTSIHGIGLGRDGLPVPCRVLLVEEDELLAGTIARLLTGYGCTVDHCPGPVAALQRHAAGEPWDLLVTSLLQAEASGPELAKSLWSRDPELPVVMLTPSADQSAPVVQADRRCECLAKPCRGRDIIDAARRLYRRRTTAQTPA